MGAVMMGQDLTAGRHSLVVFRDGSYADGAHFFLNNFGPITRSRCYSGADAKAVSCEPLVSRRDQARQRLLVSDSIVAGDLVPALHRALTPRE